MACVRRSFEANNYLIEDGIDVSYSKARAEFTRGEGSRV